MITREDVVLELKKVGESFPSRMNPTLKDGLNTCVYTSNRGEHCLVGEVLTNLGHTVPSYRSKLNNIDFFKVATGRDYRDIDLEAIGILGDIQEIADRGMTWGESICMYFNEL